ncbi:mucin-19-like isoform X7 [Haliotis rufescens]|uniref:mucin-19-like isoform X7 n=1 Tax=Haliotis rufescens TaxID=6454 RepID=UPI00201F86DC|nr:mucin-19-like isoform X7 [Haliotis rufescens]
MAPGASLKTLCLGALLFSAIEAARVKRQAVGNSACQPLPAPNNGKINCATSPDGFDFDCTATCNTGFQFKTNEASVERSCDNFDGNWFDGKDVPECQPLCSPGCLNGGSCKEPNKCACIDGWRGTHCQHHASLCVKPAGPMFGSIQCKADSTATVCTVGCAPTFTFKTPPAAEYRCTADGTWSPPKESIPDCVQEQVVAPSVQPTGSLIHPEVNGDATCVAWGQDHYRTFDNKMYTFQGNCHYLLAKDCAFNTFDIHVINDGNCTVGKHCKRELDIYMGATKISLRQGAAEPEVTWNDAPVKVPGAHDGVVYELVGSYITIKSGLGFKVKWDGKESIFVQVADDLKGKTCGLCGRYDGDPNNDFETDAGKVVTSAASFATSWKKELLDGSSCPDVSQHGVCKMDTPQNSQKALKASSICQQLLTDGSFAACHAVVDVNPYVEACKTDCCNGDANSCMCNTFEAYSRECMSKKVKLSWRKPDRCPVVCQRNLIFKECGSPCQKRCQDTSATCNEDACVDGCFCPDSTVLHNGECIPADTCPCENNGHEFNHGATIPRDCNTCTCYGGKWNCTSKKCEATCSATGDPHYMTFDGFRYNFMGTCSYYLIYDPNFDIIVDNIKCGHGEASCTKSVTLDVNGMNIKLDHNHQLFVNGKEITKLPYKAQGIKIFMVSSLFMQAELDNGIKILWDGRTRAYITAPPSFMKKTKGLCGYFDGNQNNDFLTKEGDIETNVNAFGNRWKTEATCRDMPTTPQAHPCDLNAQRKAKAVTECKKIKSDTFKECHDVVDVDQFYDDCLYDTCACTDNLKDCMCPNFGEYADTCASKGIKINWRSEITECALVCTGGQEYQVCGSPCARTCRNIAENEACQERCVEGCNCPAGESLNNDGECVSITQCPCIFDEREYAAGYTTIKGEELCECVGAKWHCQNLHGKDGSTPLPTTKPIQSLCEENKEYTTCVSACPVTCDNVHDPPTCTTSNCEPGCVCKPGFVKEGDRCVESNQCPCHHGGKAYFEDDKIVMDCNECTCKSRKWECETKDCPAICSTYGDSHYRTFDGKPFEFQGNCDYVLAKSTDINGVKFLITTENIPCGTSGVTCTKAIEFSVGEPGSADFYRLDLVRGKQVTTEPGSPFDIKDVGNFIYINTTLGIAMQWDKGTTLYIRLSTPHRNKVVGLCGNFNGDQKDDFQMPQGGPPAVKATTFGDSWKVHDYCAPSTVITDTCEAAPHRKPWAQKKCGIMQSDLFEPCHHVVAYQAYMDKCIFDACACDLGGDCECLCTAIAAYAHECAVKGVAIRWRSNELCAIECTDCFTYNPCISTCPKKTCDNRLVYDQLTRDCKQDLCFEGCDAQACLPGQVYDNNVSPMKCIPEPFCNTTACVLNGRAYRQGERITDETICRSECEICTCTNGELKRMGYCTGSTPFVSTPSVIPTAQPTVSPTIHTVSSETATPYATTAIPPTCLSTGWTSWMSSSVPTPANIGDIETISGLRKSYSFCDHSMMSAIDCRVVGQNTKAEMSGQKVTCNLREGLKCYHKDQPSGLCLDFEVRYYCDCSAAPSASPVLPGQSGKPTASPSAVQSGVPTSSQGLPGQSGLPTASPSAGQSGVPTSSPALPGQSGLPTASPSAGQSGHPTASPSAGQSGVPTSSPVLPGQSGQPTASPIAGQSGLPTATPGLPGQSGLPTASPSAGQSGLPTATPGLPGQSGLPTASPSAGQSGLPTATPGLPGQSGLPTASPSAGQSGLPTATPGLPGQSGLPTASPSAGQSGLPTATPGLPGQSGLPTASPSAGQSGLPTATPGLQGQSGLPTASPSAGQSGLPTATPGLPGQSGLPTASPSAGQSGLPTATPGLPGQSGLPTASPSAGQSGLPTATPGLPGQSGLPTASPSAGQSGIPTSSPGLPGQSGQPTASPSAGQSGQPTASPNVGQSGLPTSSVMTKAPYSCTEGWSSWMNIDRPTISHSFEFEGEGDHEDLDALRYYYSFCSQPSSVQCRSATSGQMYHMTADVGTECNIKQGFSCANDKQAAGICDDYEISVFCDCGQNPTAVPTAKPTLAPGYTTPKPGQPFESIPSCMWTQWMNSFEKKPGTDGDFETMSSLRLKYPFCAQPVAIQCRVKPTSENPKEISYEKSGGMGVSCNLNRGLVCVDSMQPNGKKCLDYEVRVYCTDACPSTVAPEGTPTAEPPKSETSFPTASPGLQGKSSQPTASPSAGQSGLPTASPGVTGQSGLPTASPGVTGQSGLPTVSPGVTGQSGLPTVSPGVTGQSGLPTVSPGVTGQSGKPTASPSAGQSGLPTVSPGVTGQSGKPTASPSAGQSGLPTASPSGIQGGTPTASLQICKEGWTGWINSDKPTVGNGDVETVSGIAGYPKTCMKVLSAECRVAETKADYRSTGQQVNCDGTGLECINGENQQCADYEVRFYCFCGEETTPGEVPSVTPTARPSVSPVAGISGQPETIICNHGWTSMMNEARPGDSDGGDLETIDKLRKSNKFCDESNIISIECVVAGTNTGHEMTGQQVTCDKQAGLLCFNSKQSNGQCLDYAVRFFCDCAQSTPYNPVVTTYAVYTGSNEVTPSLIPSAKPSVSPVVQITSAPPSIDHSGMPTASPIPGQSGSPSAQPPTGPGGLPTASPGVTGMSGLPTASPSTGQSGLPTASPSTGQSGQPTASPIPGKSSQPTASPGVTGMSGLPTASQGATGKSGEPTASPSAGQTGQPTASPVVTGMSGLPTASPSVTGKSGQPTASPSAGQSGLPTASPSVTGKSGQPTASPSAGQSSLPTASPGVTGKSGVPTASPSAGQSGLPTITPGIGQTGLPTAVPTVCGWTKWMNSNTPDNTGEMELLANLRQQFQFCHTEDITALECRDSNTHKSASESGQVGVTCDMKYSGLMCSNNKQMVGGTCFDYEVRVLCEPKGVDCSKVPTAIPTVGQSGLPTASPVVGQTGLPTGTPSILGQPSISPSAAQSGLPTASPSAGQSGLPGVTGKSSQPTASPSAGQSGVPTASPGVTGKSGQPTASPSAGQSGQPTVSPGVTGKSGVPTASPSAGQSGLPTASPGVTGKSSVPTASPSAGQSGQPTATPVIGESGQPTAGPPGVTGKSGQPTASPSAGQSGLPTAGPPGVVGKSGVPTATPGVTGKSGIPTASPSAGQSGQPTASPGIGESGQPTAGPPGVTGKSGVPTASPSAGQSGLPTATPGVTGKSGIPTASPSAGQSGLPTAIPGVTQKSGQPTASPSAGQSGQPTATPGLGESGQPTASPSAGQSGQPTASPGVTGTSGVPTASPVAGQSGLPTAGPPGVTGGKSGQPTASPSAGQSGLPTASPVFGSSSSVAPGMQTTAVVGQTTTPVLICPNPMTNTAALEVPDNHLSASSSLSEYAGPQRSNIDAVSDKVNIGAWMPKTMDKGQWIEARFDHPEYINAIITKGREGSSQWVKAFMIAYSIDGKTFQYYEKSAGSPKIFNGNFDGDSAVRTVLTPIVARYIRIQPVIWEGAIALRFSIIGCRAPEEVLPTLVPSAGPTAAPQQSCVTSTWSAWVNTNRATDGQHEFMTEQQLTEFCPSGKVDKVECETVDKIPSYSTGEIVQCTVEKGLVCKDGDNAPIPCSDYRVRYHCDCSGVPTASPGQTGSGLPTASPGQAVSGTPTASPGVQLTASPTPNIPAGCREEMGMANGIIRNDMISASSYRDGLHSAISARLGGNSAWLAATENKNQYIQVDFLAPRIITGVTTQGRPTAPSYVTSYKVFYSYDGANWNAYRETKGEDMMFSGNFDNLTPVTNTFMTPIRARYIRISPQTWSGMIALRFEIHGCFESYPTMSPTPVNPLKPTASPLPGSSSTAVPPQVQTVTPFLPAGCVTWDKWIDLGHVTLTSNGDREPIEEVKKASLTCQQPMSIECRTATPDHTASGETGQKVTCNLWEGLVCNNADQKEPMCFNYEVRLGCLKQTPECLSKIPTATPTAGPSVSPPINVIPCYTGMDLSQCPKEGCSNGYYCDGVQCVKKAECPCMIDGQVVLPGQISQNSNCDTCQCVHGEVKCLPKTCSPCKEGLSTVLDKDTCECECETCAIGDFRCGNGQCIPHSARCDGVADCTTDEFECMSTPIFTLPSTHPPSPTMPGTAAPTLTTSHFNDIITPSVKIVTTGIVPNTTVHLPPHVPTPTACVDVKCSPLVQPPLNQGEVAKVIKSPDGCCEEYLVVCEPRQCPTISKDCMKPEVLTMVDSGERCCPEYTCVCPPKCPVPAQPPCAFGSQVVDIFGGCNCTTKACVAGTTSPFPVVTTAVTIPVCTYSMTKVVTNGKEVDRPRPVEVTHTVGQQWADGLCKTCQCVNTTSGTAETTCHEQQCPACKLGEERRTTDGTCCGECMKTGCVDSGKVYKQGEKIPSSMKCFEKMCTVDIMTGDFILQQTQIQCESIDKLPVCTGSEKAYDSTGCCLRCVPTDMVPTNSSNSVCQSCTPRLMFGQVQQSIGFFKVNDEGEVCSNVEPIPELKECAGYCGSTSSYTSLMRGFDNKCLCCQPAKTVAKSVQLVCGTGRKITKTYNVPETCGCSACSNGA